MNTDDLDDLRYAKSLLENPGLAAKLTNLLGAPLERGFDLLPKGFRDRIQSVVKVSLNRALDVAVMSMGENHRGPSSNLFHKLLVGASGAIGGAFGLAALSFELPISTTVMLRSIADIARSEGEGIGSVGSKLACLEVFALGGRSKGDNGAESGYYAIRAALARAVTEAAEYITERGLVQEGAPALLRLIAAVASRFGVVVTEKAAAQAIPIIGAAGGAAINALFIDHFQDMARGHFIIRRLERTYGPEEVQEHYDRV